MGSKNRTLETCSLLNNRSKSRRKEWGISSSVLPNGRGSKDEPAIVQQFLPHFPVVLSLPPAACRRDSETRCARALPSERKSLAPARRQHQGPHLRQSVPFTRHGCSPNTPLMATRVVTRRRMHYWSDCVQYEPDNYTERDSISKRAHKRRTLLRYCTSVPTYVVGGNFSSGNACKPTFETNTPHRHTHTPTRLHQVAHESPRAFFSESAW